MSERRPDAQVSVKTLPSYGVTDFCAPWLGIEPIMSGGSLKWTRPSFWNHLKASGYFHGQPDGAEGRDEPGAPGLITSQLWSCKTEKDTPRIISCQRSMQSMWRRSWRRWLTRMPCFVAMELECTRALRADMA